MFDNERVRATVRGLAGLARRADGDQRRVDTTITLVVTDRRVLFVPGELSLANPSETNCGAVAFAEMESVSLAPRDEGRWLTVGRPDGVEWLVPLPPAEDPAIEATFRHLHWIGRVRSRVCDVTEAVSETVTAMQAAAADRDWQSGLDGYAETRARLDRVLDTVYCTEPVDAAALAPDLTDAERQLERAAAELWADRAETARSLVQELVAIGEYGLARRALEEAREAAGNAREHALAVRRGDAFVFGEQRALDDRLDRLSWQLDMVAAEPLRQGHEAAIRGETATEPTECIEHFECALRCYGRLLGLAEDAQEPAYGGDPASVRQTVADTAATLVELYDRHARRLWNEAVAHHEATDTATALSLYAAACDHLDRAHALAEPLDGETASRIDRQRAVLADALEHVRETEDQPSDGSAPVAGDRDAQPAPEPPTTADPRGSPDTRPPLAPSDAGEGDQGGSAPSVETGTADADEPLSATEAAAVGRTDGGHHVPSPDGE